MTSVRVELWIGEATYACSVADMFGGDVLTVTHDGGIETRIEPSVWRNATTYDERGYPLSYFVATTPAHRPLPFTAKELRS